MRNFYLVHTHLLPILDQLRLEEALLRADTHNWCLINSGSPDAIVMGISGKVEQLVHQEAQRQKAIPLIKRFSGGGTVYVDSQTLFVTFIGNEEDTQVTPQPRKILEWTERLYQPFFSPHPFRLIENDYAMHEHKFGGNAQYVQKNRWLHHSSFLWDYQSEKMALLKLPPKRPTYRQDRSHDHFLTTLNRFYSNKEEFVQSLSEHLKKQLNAIPLSLEEALLIKERPHRKSTILVA